MTDQPAGQHAPDPDEPAAAARVADAPGPDADPVDSADPAAAAEPDAAPKPRLRRGRDRNKVIAGVCHGAGVFFGVDPVIFRVVLVVLSLTGGIGLIVYGMGWLVIPQEGERESEAHRLLSGRIEGAPLTAVLMALVGCGLYASMIGNGANQAFSLLLLTGTAAAVYWSQRRAAAAAGEMPAPGAGPGGATRVATAVPEAPPAVQAPPEPGAAPSWWREPLTKEPAYLWGPDDGPYEAEDKAAWRARRRQVRREHSSWLFGLAVFLLTVTALCVGAGVSWPYQPAAVSAEIGLASALGVLGVAFVVASFAGRARGGTTFFAVLTIAALIGTAMLPKSGQGFGRTTWTPLTASAVQPSYQRGAGAATLDLTRVALDGRTVSTKVHIGAGQAEVRLPRNATVDLDYDLGVGELVLPGKVNDGVDVHGGQHGARTFAALPGTVASGTIRLEVSVGVGQVKVVR
jgi:phage shock protein PspC (stress-responsive transcriptional regulator)